MSFSQEAIMRQHRELARITQMVDAANAHMANLEKFTKMARIVEQANQVTKIVEQAEQVNQTFKRIEQARLIDSGRHSLKVYEDNVNRHTVAHSGGVSGPRAKVAVVADVSDGSATGEGSNSGGGGVSDDDGGDGDGDGDGPRRRSASVPSIVPLQSRCSSRAVWRRLKPKHSTDVIMHTRALLTLVLIFSLCLCGAAGFALLRHEGLALKCLGLAAVDGWALASKLVKPK